MKAFKALFTLAVLALTGTVASAQSWSMPNGFAPSDVATSCASLFKDNILVIVTLGISLVLIATIYGIVTRRIRGMKKG